MRGPSWSLRRSRGLDDIKKVILDGGLDVVALYPEFSFLFFDWSSFRALGGRKSRRGNGWLWRGRKVVQVDVFRNNLIRE